MTPDEASLRAGVRHARDAAKHAGTPEAKKAAFRLAAELAAGLPQELFERAGAQK